MAYYAVGMDNIHVRLAASRLLFNASLQLKSQSLTVPKDDKEKRGEILEKQTQSMVHVLVDRLNKENHIPTSSVFSLSLSLSLSVPLRRTQLKTK